MIRSIRRRRARRHYVTAIIGQGITNVIKGITVTALIARRTSNEEKRIE